MEMCRTSGIFYHHDAVVYVITPLNTDSGVLGHSISHRVDTHNLWSLLPFDTIFGFCFLLVDAAAVNGHVQDFAGVWGYLENIQE